MRLHALGAGEEKSVEEEFSEAAESMVYARLQKEIDELEEVAEERRVAHARLKTEVDNFRKRTGQELSAARRRAALPVIAELLPVADEFDLAAQSLKADSAGEQAVAGRFEELFGQMMETWKALGVQRLGCMGEEFDPELHEAVSMIPSSEYEENTVCGELRAGWILRRPGSDEPQVLRPALVCVSSGSPPP